MESKQEVDDSLAYEQIAEIEESQPNNFSMEQKQKLFNAFLYKKSQMGDFGPENQSLIPNHTLRQINNLDQMSPNDRMFMIIDKDTGNVIDSRNEAVVAQIIDEQTINQLQFQLSPEENEVIWKEFWNTVRNKNYDLQNAAENNDCETIKELLDHNQIYPIDVNVRTLDDFTPIHFAIMYGNKEALELLVSHGGDLQAESSIGRRPIHICAIKGYSDIMEFILSHKVELDCQDNDFNTPLHHATERGHYQIVELLLKYDASTTIQNQRKCFPYDVTSDIHIKNIYQKYGKIQQGPSQYQISYGSHQIGTTREAMINKLLDKTKMGRSSLKPQQEEKKDQPPEGRVSKLKKDKWTTSFSPPERISLNIKLGPSDFTYWKQLGKGAFGEVFLVSYKDEFYAMKILRKDKIMKQKLEKYAKTEKDVLFQMNNPFITKLYYAFQTDLKLFLVMEYCPGGDLGNLLSAKRKLPEEQARIYIAEILLAIEALHNEFIIYRDLKPENVLLDHQGHCKLTDFGLAKQNVLDEKLNTSFLGTPAYFAPEIVTRSGHTRMLDWYNLGVLLYELLVGMPPFYARDRDELFENIKKAPIKIPKSMSNEAKDLIKLLLNRNFKKRLGAQRDGEEIREHAFFSCINWDDLYNKKVSVPKPNIQPNPKEPLKVLITSPNTEKDKFNNWTVVENQNVII